MKLLSLLLLFPAFTFAQQATVVGGSHCEILYAGQNIDAGLVCVEVVDEDLVVSYSTKDGWGLMETHLWVGDDLADMPQTRKGNPKIGNFPYQAEDLAGATSYSFTLPLSILNFSCPMADTTYYVAAHAAVQRDNGDGTFQTETGWGAGDPIVVKGNWATYFNFTLTCEDDPVDPPEPVSCETTFAFGGDYGTCFIGADFDEDNIDDGFNRWGWSNGPIGPGSYAFEIYGGAGQCDLNKGTHVGTLNVSYDGSVAIVSYQSFEGFYMQETHLYVGNAPLAVDSNGEYTVAPGQYPHKHDLNDVAFDAFVVPDLSGDIYVVAHGVVCGAY